MTTLQNNTYFHSPLAEFVYTRTYARWLPNERRRETWPETVTRYVEFMRENLGDRLTNDEYHEVQQAILYQQVMPSMRLLQFAGDAVRATQVAAYNCAFLAPTCIDDFAEVMYISLCGTGVGFSVEQHTVQQLPFIKTQTGTVLPPHVILDSKEGWSDALKLGMQTWFAGHDISFDFTKIRPQGARLKTFGGKSSGPEPLRHLLHYTRQLILQHQTQQLSSLAVHDLLCKIGEVVVAGGTRRSAMISLSDVSDISLRNAKQGEFYKKYPERMLANNSAVYNTLPPHEILQAEWQALINHGTGERGIFNRGSLMNTLPARRLDYFRRNGLINHQHISHAIGTNPCGEIILQSKQFCNLTEVVARTNDDSASLLHKIKIAALLGTYQATLTHFPYLSRAWQDHCEQESLLGVSITGHWDCALLRQAATLQQLKAHAIATNQHYAKRFGINAATAVTCVKPSGTVSQTVSSAPGMHPHYAPYYIRRIRISADDALFKLLRAQGIPYHPEVGQTEATANTFVLEFPVQAPANAICQKDLTALQQLEHWKLVKINYTEHNPSVTVLVSEHEWDSVLQWLEQHWDIVGGLTFLPRTHHVYQLAPFEEINREQYQSLFAKFNNMQLAELTQHESEDETLFKSVNPCSSQFCET